MSEPGVSFPDAPRVQLDQRLTDLVAAANQVLETQGRLRALLRANQAITQQLDLDSVLRSVVTAARQLTGAKYAALGVIGEHGGLEQFIHEGMDQGDVDRIGHLPRGEGLLGALISDPRSIRVTDIRADPRSAGLPDGHPPMQDFLGVPVPVRGVVYGNLYITDSPAGLFDDEDEQLVRSLAATAGFAIENARLYRETRRGQQWAAASAEITARLLGPDAGDAVSLIAEKVQDLAEAMSTFVILVADEPDRVSVVDVRGADPNRMHGATAPLSGTISDRVIRSGIPERFEEHEARALGLPEFGDFGPVMAIPLATSERVLGAFVVARAPGRSAFTDADLIAATDFAGRAGVALELVRARAHTEEMMLFDDRGRIARDLHDRVIQQLFATGMQLQSMLGTLPPGRDAERVDNAIAALDDSIVQIRRIIFTLQSAGRGAERKTTRQRLFDLIHQLSAGLAVEPTIAVSGPVDAVIDGDLAEDVLATVSEGVTNAVKHARAKDVAVAVSADVRGITLIVTNDGTPLVPSARRSGVRNLEDRAERRGGRMTLETVDDRTVLTWAIPLPSTDREPT